MMASKSFIKKAIKAVLPYGLLLSFYNYKKEKQLKKGGLLLVLQNYKNKKQFIKDYGKKSYCPICKRQGYFLHCGVIPRAKAMCPKCTSAERHRALWLFLKKHTDFFNKSSKKILHIAAEPFLRKHFKKIHGDNYITADLIKPNADVKMDITNIQYPDETFDVILCIDVLEHIVNDLEAMKELRRVLKKEGWSILNVPVFNMEKTYEDFSITGEAEREIAFGQKDHVRKYGLDYVERLESAGFIVKANKVNEFVDNETIKEMNLGEATTIYYCKK